MKPTKPGARSYTRQEQWKERIEEAVNSSQSNAQWCAERGINYQTFKYQKGNLQKQGYHPPIHYAKGFEVPHEAQPKLFTLQRPVGQPALRFVAQPVEKGSFEQLYYTLRYELKIEPTSEEVFVFVKRDHKQLYQYRETKRGRSITKSQIKKGTLRWPLRIDETGSADITEGQWEEILELIGVK